MPRLIKKIAASASALLAASGIAMYMRDKNEVLTSPPSPFYVRTCNEPVEDLSAFRANHSAPFDETKVYDTIVVGGGFAGLYTAIALRQRGKAVLLVESRSVGSGASGVCGGMAIPGFHADLSELEAWCGSDVAHALWGQTVTAGQWIRHLIRQHNIRCDFVDEGYLTAHRWVDAKRTSGGNEPLRADEGTTATISSAARGATTSFVTVAPHVVRQEFVSAATLRGEGHLLQDSFAVNPFALCHGLKRIALAEGAAIVENTRIESMQRLPIRADTDSSLSTSSSLSATTRAVPRWELRGVRAGVIRGASNETSPSHSVTLRANHVVCCTNAPPAWFSVPLSRLVIPIYSAILVTPPIPDSVLNTLLPRRINICDDRRVLAYFRRVEGNRILWGGRMPSAVRLPTHWIQGMLYRDMLRAFPCLDRFIPSGVASCDVWCGRMITGFPPLPIVGRVHADGRPYRSTSGSPSTDDGLWVNAGHFCHGVIPTAAAGEAVARAICGDATSLVPWEAAQPTMPVPGPMKQLVAQACSVAWMIADLCEGMPR